MTQPIFGDMYTARVTRAFSPGGSVVRAQMSPSSAEVRRLNIGDIIEISENTARANNYDWYRTTDGYVARTSAFAVERVAAQPAGITLTEEQTAQIQTLLSNIDAASQSIRSIINSAASTPP